MEFIIFIIIVIISIAANSAPKKGSKGGPGDEDWNLEEFDFSKIIVKPQAPPAAGGGKMPQAPPPAGQSQAVEDYKDIKTDHVEDHSYDFSKLTGPAQPVPQARDAYAIDMPAGREVDRDTAAKSRGESMKLVAPDTDSTEAVEALAAAASSGDVINAATVKTVAERTAEKKKRQAFKAKSSKEKSEVMEVETPATTTDDAEENSNLKELFAGGNIRRSFVASIVFERPEF